MSAHDGQAVGRRRAAAGDRPARRARSAQHDRFAWRNRFRSLTHAHAHTANAHNTTIVMRKPYRHGMIRPTVRLIVLLALAGVALFFALAVDSTALMALAISVPALAVISLIVTLATRPLINCQRGRMDDDATRDFRRSVVTIVRRCMIPGLIRRECQWSQLDQHDHVIRRFRSTDTPVDRGLYRLDATAVTWFDGFGLWKSRRLISEHAERLNPPDIALAEPKGIMPMSSHPGRGEETDAATVRRYESGDPWRMIAWRASAHRGTLMTREGSRDARSDTLIVVDTSTGCSIDVCLATAAQRYESLRAAGVRVSVTDGETVYSNADAIERFLAAAQSGDHDVTVGERARQVAQALGRLPGYTAVLLTPESAESAESGTTDKPTESGAGERSSIHIPKVVHTTVDDVDRSGDSRDGNDLHHAENRERNVDERSAGTSNGDVRNPHSATVSPTISSQSTLEQALCALIPERRFDVVRVPKKTGIDSAASAATDSSSDSDSSTAQVSSGVAETAAATSTVPAIVAQAITMPVLLAIAVWQTSTLFSFGWWTWFAFAALPIIGVDAVIPVKRRIRLIRGLVVSLLVVIAAVILAILRIRRFAAESAVDIPSSATPNGSPQDPLAQADEQTGIFHSLTTVINALSAGAIEIYEQYVPVVLGGNADALLILVVAAIAIVLRILLIFRPVRPIIAVLPIAIAAVDYAWAGQELSLPWIVVCLVSGSALLWSSHDHRTHMRPPVPLIASLIVTSIAVGFTPMAVTAAQRVDISLGEGGGLFSNGTINPMIDLKRGVNQTGATTVFTYTANERLYFRLATLDDFNGDTWSFSSRLSERGGFYNGNAGETGNDGVTTSSGSAWSPVAGQYMYSPYNRFNDATPIEQYLDVLGGTQSGGAEGADWEVNTKVTIDSLNSRFLPVPSGSVNTSQATSAGVWRRGGDSAFYSVMAVTMPGMTYTADGTYITPIRSSGDFSTIDALNTLKTKANESRTSQTFRIRVGDDPTTVTDTNGNRIGEFTRNGIRFNDDVIDQYGLRGRSWLIGIPEVVINDGKSDVSTGVTAYEVRGYTIELNPSAWLVRLMSDMYGALGAGAQVGDNEFSFLVPPMQTMFNSDGSMTTAGTANAGDGSRSTDAVIDERIPSGYDELPDVLPAQVTAVVDQAKRQGVPTSGGGAESQIAAMEYLVDYFTHNGFSYSVSAPDGSGRNNMQVIGDFLDRKTGYCAHYASALAVLGRAMGVKTRMVLGYSPGSGESSDGSYAVASNQLHSWVEAYINGLGWIPFDVTPAYGVDAATGTDAGQTAIAPSTSASASAQPSDTSSSSASQNASATPSVSQSGSADTDTPDDGENADSTTDGDAVGQGDQGWAAFLHSRAATALAVLAAMVCGYAIVSSGMWIRAWRRRRRIREIRAIHADGDRAWLIAWRELTDTAWDWSVRWPTSATEQDIADTIVQWIRRDDVRKIRENTTEVDDYDAVIDTIGMMADHAEAAAYGGGSRRNDVSGVAGDVSVSRFGNVAAADSADTESSRIVASLDDARAVLSRVWSDRARSLPAIVRIGRLLSLRLVPRSLFRR
ncbi:Transglutaminase-like superfamily [Bifidobacterium tissieri]|uniref:Transglutaminase-like superfamily n=1 Tax=Bifidobacterium tissieri TaxID=1630162 RepID=A0A261FI04_9BIFI|nr:transglutaminaseTgpA domain-containing protein [Bifidobacterium tissieri]OZG58777.1 Transglutaminase-like superfamily [Bifidobacterium tissieri]